MKVLKEGTKIFCSNCNAEICTANKTITSTSMARVKDFNFAPDQKKVRGEPMTCTKCGYPYLDTIIDKFKKEEKETYPDW